MLYNTNKYSRTLDLFQTIFQDYGLIKIISPYDNLYNKVLNIFDLYIIIKSMGKNYRNCTSSII